MLKVEEYKCPTCEHGSTWEQLTDPVNQYEQGCQASLAGLEQAAKKLREAREEGAKTNATAQQLAAADGRLRRFDELFPVVATETAAFGLEIAGAYEPAKEVDCNEIKGCDPSVRCPRLDRIMPAVLEIPTRAQVTAQALLDLQSSMD